MTRQSRGRVSRSARHRCVGALRQCIQGGLAGCERPWQALGPCANSYCDKTVRTDESNGIRTRHAVLDGAVRAGGAIGHALEPQVAERNVGLQVRDTVVLGAHPVLLVHRQAPALLLGEEPLEELVGVDRDGVLVLVPRDVGPVVDVVRFVRPLPIVHHRRELELVLDRGHAGREDRRHRGPVHH